MDRLRSPSSDRTFALQGVCLKTPGAGEKKHPTLLQLQSSKVRIIYCLRITKKFRAYDLVR